MLNENISALMDGELNERETAALLERVRQDPALRAAWARQHYLQMAIQERPPREISGDFVDQVMIRVATDEVDAGTKTRRGRPFGKSRSPSDQQNGMHRRGWYRPVTGFAMAASVAAVAVIVTDYQAGVQTLPEGVPAVTAAAPHAERVARSGAIAPTDDGATLMAAETHQIKEVGAADPALTKVAQSSEPETDATSASAQSESAGQVATETGDGKIKLATSAIASGNLESLISSEESPLNWDAATLGQDQELRRLLFNHSSDSDAGSVSGMLGFMRITAEAEPVVAEAAEQVTGQAAQ